MKLGTVLPEFSLADRKGKKHSPCQATGKPVVLYFYPKDNTPGCSIQAKAYSEALTAFNKLGVEVFGISGGDDKSKEKFCQKYNLKVTLLSDPSFALCRMFGAFGPKVFMGRRYNGISRNTYVFDKQHKLVKIIEKADPASDAETVLELIKALEEGSSSDLKKVETKKVETKKTAAKKTVKTGAVKTPGKTKSLGKKLAAKKPKLTSAPKESAARKTAPKKVAKKQPAKKASKRA